MMNAAIRERYVSEDGLEVKSTEQPKAGPNDILVKVNCTTVNRTDCSVLTGKPFVMRFFIGLFRPRLKVTGTDFAGEVISIGSEVSEFKIGDHVFGFNDEGLSSHAEYLSIDQNDAVAHIPKDTTYINAVASAEGAHYALNFLNKIDLPKSAKVIVNGASGAIGSAAIQLLKVLNVDVTVVCNTKNMENIKSLGFSKIINYEEEDFTALDDKFDFVLDSVGKSRFKYCQRILKENGVYVSSELGPNAENIWLAIVKRNKKQQRVIFPIPTNRKKSINDMAQLLKEKKFTPLIDRIYPLHDISEAFKYVKTGMKSGNVIIKIEE